MPKCYCCGETYTRRAWRCCASPLGTPSHVWLVRWHGTKPNLKDGECGKCPKHCQCEGRKKGSQEMIQAAKGWQEVIDNMRENTLRS